MGSYAPEHGLLPIQSTPEWDPIPSSGSTPEHGLPPFRPTPTSTDLQNRLQSKFSFPSHCFFSPEQAVLYTSPHPHSHLQGWCIPSPALLQLTPSPWGTSSPILFFAAAADGEFALGLQWKHHHLQDSPTPSPLPPGSLPHLQQAQHQV